jgi:acetylornithine aminotransferase
MAASLATLSVMIDEGIANRSRETGDYLMAGLSELKREHPSIREIRGRGLMIGVVLDGDIGSLPLDGLKKGILLNVIQNSILRLVPPLIISRDECDEALALIHELLKEKGL